ncbi:MAG: helix-turn-helix domain-containing protein [Saprospiraceae bacterium]
MNLGKTIKELRKAKNFKQNLFAEECLITQSYLSNIENNKKEPTLSTLDKISNVLNIPLPIIFFLSMDEADVKADKISDFKAIEPLLSQYVKSIFL